MAAEAKEAPRERWTYVIGDVHGCYDELRRLEDLAHEHASSHGVAAFFVCVGDLVDRGPRVKEVVAHVRKGVRAGTHACVGGNHEALFAETLWALAPWNFEISRGWPLPSTLALYSPGIPLRHASEGLPAGLTLANFAELSRTRWMRCGGRETLASFGCDPDDVDSWHVNGEDLAFLVGLPLLWENARAVVTHAYATRAELDVIAQLSTRGKETPLAFHESLSIEEQRILDSALWSREAPSEAPAPGRFHVTGHTPLEGPFLNETTGVVNVDTACVFGNTLTALCLETGTFLSVPGWQDSPFR
ncbi:MAG: metallophosphoesterase [Silvanigrellales bacterium]|nr:metallophosphoesterase [Silvanigrellales bacterium]